jgi:hypothetical protein
MTVDLSAIAKWPNVPACYDWLSLDRRGDWRLQGERVTHRGLIEFINRQYACDEAGRWFLQNGPQRVFVRLAATPWIFRRDGDALLSHTGQPAGALRAAYLDDGGNLLFDSELGCGLLDDRDLAATLAECRRTDGTAAEEGDFLALMQGEAADIAWRQLALTPIAANQLPQRFSFDPDPRP